MEYITKKSSDLATGDVVVRDCGLRVRIEEVHQIDAWGMGDGLEAEGLSRLTTWSKGTVLNVDEAVANGFPKNYLDRDGERYTWTIQGNDRAKWLVEA